MVRIKIYPAPQESIEARESVKKCQRNALGYIHLEQIDDFLKQVIERGTELGMGPQKSHPHPNEHRIYFMNPEYKKKNLSDVDFQKGVQLGFFLEPMLTVDRVEDPARYMIWIYFNVSGPSLTKFKIHLLEQMLEVVNFKPMKKEEFLKELDYIHEVYENSPKKAYDLGMFQDQLLALTMCYKSWTEEWQEEWDTYRPRRFKGKS